MSAPNPLPGFRTGRSVSPRNILWSRSRLDYVSGVIDSVNAYDGSNTNYEDELREGLVMARITATKKWVPCKRTTVLSGGGTVATCVLTDARTFKVGDTITINGDAVTIVTITYSTNTITWTGNQTIVNGEVVIASGSLAGAEIPRAVLNEFIKLKDEDSIWRDKSFSMGLISGYLDNAQILGDLTAIRAATNYLAQVQWADQQGAN
jgi:hypothetical protein